MYKIFHKDNITTFNNLDEVADYLNIFNDYYSNVAFTKFINENGWHSSGWYSSLHVVVDMSRCKEVLDMFSDKDLFVNIVNYLKRYNSLQDILN